jgi:L-iditol 2-dehydrogenase
VRVAQAGLCGTDLKIAAGEIPVARPRVLGHEMTGWVDRAGARGLLPAGTPLPAGLPSDGAALLQLLSTCVHAQSLLTVHPADSAVVAGLGVAGLLHVQLLRDRGADLAIEAAGSQQTLVQAMRLAAPGGTVLVYGTTAPAADGLPTYDWYLKELTIRNTRAARPRDCDLAIRLYADRRVDLAPLVTARFPVEQAGQALAACAAPGQLKVVLDVAGQPA